MDKTNLLCRTLIGLATLTIVAAAAAAEQVRPSALAGGWYPADPEELQAQVDGFLDAAGLTAPPGQIRALILPHAGYAYSGATAGQVVSLVKGRTYRRVLVLAPSHHSGFHGLSIPEVNAYRTPLGDVPLDVEAIEALRASPLVGAHTEAHVREHSVEIELPLLQRAFAPGWRLVPILVGRIGPGDYQAVADLLRPFADEDTLVLVSSDFTHYGPRFGYLPFAEDEGVQARIQALDDGALNHILDKDATGFLAYQAQTGITICGYRPIAILLHMLGSGARVERVAYTTSGALTGDWSNSVSYAGLVVTDPQPLAVDVAPVAPEPESAPAPAPEQESAPDGSLTDEDLKLLHRLAILALEDAVLGASVSRTATLAQELERLPQKLHEPAGAFVTLKRHGDLRGCIGTIRPIQPLYQAVLDNGDNAARRDSRFRPVQASELEGIDVEVSVLSPPRPIDSWEEFRVGEQGIILSKDGHRAVFLPEVATEQGWTREQTLSYLTRKAGLSADDWREGATFEVFTSTKYAAPYAAP